MLVMDVSASVLQLAAEDNFNLRSDHSSLDRLRANARTANPNRQLNPASQHSTPSIRTPLSDKSHSLQIWHESLFIEGIAISSKQREFVYE